MIEFDEIYIELQKEIAESREKFGSFQSTHEGYAVILEELCEVWDAIRINDLEAAENEAYQVAAMAIKFIQDMKSMAPRSNCKKHRGELK
jgi:NTP pyrophosphatase (non-canonical NTP hydrolase)